LALVFYDKKKIFVTGGKTLFYIPTSYIQPVLCRSDKLIALFYYQYLRHSELLNN